MSLLTFWRAIFAVLFITVTYLTLTPDPDDTQSGLAVTRWIASLLFGDEQLGDKVAHFSAYFCLGAAAVFARVKLFGRAVATSLALAAYGALLERLQGYTGVRAPELVDALANAAGALAALPVSLVMVEILERRLRR